MSKKVLISMLKQGNDGNEILAILDAITDIFETETEEIEF